MADEDGRGTLADLIAVLVAALADPPTEAMRAMALVVGPAGGGDHVGLLMRGQPSPGGLDILATVISARAQPRASVLLEWALAGSRPCATTGAGPSGMTAMASAGGASPPRRRGRSRASDPGSPSATTPTPASTRRAAPQDGGARHLRRRRPRRSTSLLAPPPSPW